VYVLAAQAVYRLPTAYGESPQGTDSPQMPSGTAGYSVV
jgi:hypothetical protein